MNLSTIPKETLERIQSHALARKLGAISGWSEDQFKQNLEGSAIRRIGHERWLRNIAVGLGNAASLPHIVAALETRAGHPSALVREHVEWALSQHRP